MQKRCYIIVFILELFSAKTYAQCSPATFQSVFNITQTTADPTISNNGGGTNYLEYGTGVWSPGTGASAGAGGTLVAIPTNTNHLILTGLQPGTTYNVYTRKNCSGTWSANSFMYMFATLPFTMTITSAVPANICNDAVFNVSFSTNAIAFAGNTYSIQLSDPSGSFGGPFPLIIGTLNSTATSGTIPVNLGPQSPMIFGGSGYRIRVTSSNPVSGGTDNGSNITISEMIQNGVANIQSSGTPYFCGPASRTYTVGSILHATSFTWAAPPGALITSGQGTQSCTISFPSSGASGFVSVYGSNANCSGPLLDVLVTANPIPASPTLLNLSACSGTPLDLSVANPMASGFSVPNPYTGPSTTFTATVTDINGCTSLPSAPASITINQLPSSSITAVGPTTFCSGGSVVLNAHVNANFMYQWRKNGANIVGAANQSYTATSAGNYKVLVTNMITGCSKLTSASTVITVNSLPTAAITPQGPVSFCAGDSVVLQANSGVGLTYKWKKSGSYISGITSNKYTATSAGTYKVEVKNVNGCSRLSTGIVVSVPCREGESIAGVSNDININVYPNPSSENFVLLIKGNKGDQYKVNIKDLLGRAVSPTNLVEAGDAIQVGQNLRDGIYLLDIISNFDRKIVRIEKR